MLALNAMMSIYDDDDLLTVLDEAYDATDNGKQGSCTAVMVLTMTDQTLQYINLGDSGVAIYRNGRLFFETNPQSIGFNYRTSYLPTVRKHLTRRTVDRCPLNR